MDETEHCMHLEENVDLWYLSEIFFSLRYMSVPSDANRSDMRLLLVCLFAPDQARRNVDDHLDPNDSRW